MGDSVDQTGARNPTESGMTVFLTVFQPSYVYNLLILLHFHPKRDCWRPGQPPGSLAEIPRRFGNRRHFSRLVAESPVLARDIGLLVQYAENSEASLCSMSFQYPKFRNGGP
jgi:hypothetical protein